MISYTDGISEMRDPIRVPVKRAVFADEKSVRQSESYQAAAVGLKAEVMFVIWPNEYEGETDLEFNGKLYSVIRTFKRDVRDLEIICIESKG
ncbi:phage head closure protein [Cohnella lupini]|uniref:phage head closure protein n=1 Tax=Cohnella lupini TaxID=1294267 RepID=UPI003CCC499C